LRSRTLHLPAGEDPGETLRQAATAEGRPPGAVLAFLPPDERLPDTLAALAATWPESLRFGCEAVTQFADAALTTGGSVQLFWFEAAEHGAAVEVVAGTHDVPPAPEAVAALAGRLAAADGTLLIADGLRFPTEHFLNELRHGLIQQELNGAIPRAAGGLASQSEPVTRIGARVFVGTEVFPAACLAVTFRGVHLRVEVVRGWTPASPVYTVTRAEGHVLREIDGAPAADWYRRFFTIDGELAPLPESAHRFPLILEGPGPERQGLYRSLRFFDQPPGAVTLWGEVRTGDRVRLGIGNDVSLVGGAAAFPPEEDITGAEAAILFSCVGRQAVLGERAGDEVAAIHRRLDGVSLSGFFTFGEIGPAAGGLAFYNHTAILVLLAEIRDP
jgi:hypothetical protein